MFERNCESLRWFELENRYPEGKKDPKQSDSSQCTTSSQSVQQNDATMQTAANRKRKFNAPEGSENSQPCEAMETDDNNFVLEDLEDDDEMQQVIKLDCKNSVGKTSCSWESLREIRTDDLSKLQL